MAGRRGPHGVRHLAGSTRPRSSRTRTSATMSLDGIVTAIEQVAQAHQAGARPVLLLPRRDAGRDRAGLAGRQGPRRRGQFGDPDRLAWSILPTCATGRRSSTKAISARSRTISRRQGFIDSVELAAPVRGDARQRPHLVVGGQPLSPRPAGAAVATCSTGSRTARGSPPPSSSSYNRDLLLDNSSRTRPASRSATRHRPRRDQDADAGHRAQGRPRLGLEAVYGGARHLGADFVLGGSGHNAGVINPPAANKHGYWTSDASPRAPRIGSRARPATRAAGGRAGPNG